MAKVDDVSKKLDMTHELLSETQTQLENISRNVHNILRDTDAPKLMYIIPEDSSVAEWISLKPLIGRKVKIIFICPVTLSIPRDGKNKPMGYSMLMPKEWVKKYGPALKISFEVLRVGFAIGRLASLPLPNISSIGKSTNHFSVMNDNLVAYMGTEAPDLKELAKAIGERTTLVVPELSEPDADLSSHLTEDMRKTIKASYEEVKKIAESNKDGNFLKTGLTKVVSDGCVDYVLNDPKIKTLYQAKGRECIGLTTEKLSALGADLHIIVKEGELETKRKSRGFKGSWKRSYFVLLKSGWLTYYPSKKEREEDPLGASGNTKPKNVTAIAIIDDNEDSIFEITYEGGLKQKFRLSLAYSNREEAAKAWAKAWVDRAMVQLSH